MKKQYKFLSLLLLLALCLPSCAKQEQFSRSFYLMDTAITVTLYTENETLAEERFALARAHLQELEALWSRHLPSSDISRLNSSHNGTDQSIDPRTLSLLRLAREVTLSTNGCFDITLAPLTDLWSACGEADRLPTDEELAAARARTGAHRYAVSEVAVEKQPGTEFDLGGIGKGTAISSLLSILPAEGIAGGMVTFGSNVAVFGKKPNGEPFRVAIRDPKSTASTVGALPLPQGSVLSVSGDYERYVTIQGHRYHHILDPSTGAPSDSGLSSVAVICSNGALADALSTALLVMGLEQALAFHASGTYAFEAVFITSGGSCHVTSPAIGFTPSNAG